MRREVEEALAEDGSAWSAIDVWSGIGSLEQCAAVTDQLRALIELGVRLGVEAAAVLADGIGDTNYYAASYWPDRIRDITVASVIEGAKDDR